MRVGLGFHIRSERCEGVEGFAAGPLALGVLDGAVADVLGCGVAEDVAGGGGGGDVADFAADDDGEFGLVVGAVLGEWDFNLAAVGQEGGGGFEPEQRLLGERLAHFARMVGVVLADGDDLGRGDGRESFQPLGFGGLLVKRRRAEDIATQAEQLPVDNFGVEDFLTLLKSPDGSHICGPFLTTAPQVCKANPGGSRREFKQKQFVQRASGETAVFNVLQHPQHALG